MKKIFAYQFLFKFFKVEIFDPKDKAFFTKLVESNMAYREAHNVKTNDFIDMLMEAKRNGYISKHNDKSLDDAGFATVAEAEEIKPNGVKIESKNFFRLESSTNLCHFRMDKRRSDIAMHDFLYRWL
jgi:hypothetical protein